MSQTTYTAAFDMTKLAETLRELRESQGWTQTRLAELLDVSPRVYNRWETGKATPRFDTVVELANALGVSLDQLAGRTEINGDRPTIRHPKLRDLYDRVDDLSAEDQEALVVLLDSLIKRSQVAHLMGT